MTRTIKVQIGNPEDARSPLPYPFFVNEDGEIGRQDYWQGLAAHVVGFAADVDRHVIDLTWRDAVAEPAKAVGMHVVIANRDDEWSTWGPPVYSMTEVQL